MTQASVARRRELKKQEKLEKQAEDATRLRGRSRRSRRSPLRLVAIALGLGAALAGAWRLGLLSRAPAERRHKLAPVPAHLAPLRYGARVEPSYYKSWRNSTVDIQGPTAPWRGVQSVGYVTAPYTGAVHSFIVIRGLMPREDVDRALAVARSLPTMPGGPEQGATPFMLKGQAMQDLFSPSGLHPMSVAMMPLLEERLVPYVRRQYNCPGCIVCNAVLRRYSQSQWPSMSRHYDTDAYLSVVVPLSPRDEYLGGLFVMTAANAHSREFLELQPGDVVLHQYGLDHGVAVLEGSRYSVVFWFSDSPGACKQGSKPWYEVAANRGDAVAQYALGSIFAQSHPATAWMWMRKAAEQGHLDAMMTLGGWYLEGQGGVQNGTLGIEWMLRAAEWEHSISQFNAGLFHHKGMAGVVQDDRLAAQWFWRAAEQGHERAQYSLGALHRYGSGSWHRDAATAVAWFRHAADQGMPEAQFQLALCYESGEGVPRDVDAAIELLRGAAERGMAMAQRELCKRYIAGTGVPLDYARAAEWASKAAKLGDADAQVILGEFFASGIGVPQSRSKARTWFRKAAQNGRQAQVDTVLQAIEGDNPGGWPGLLSERHEADDAGDADAGSETGEPPPDDDGEEDILLDGEAIPLEDDEADLIRFDDEDEV